MSFSDPTATKGSKIELVLQICHVDCQLCVALQWINSLKILQHQSFTSYFWVGKTNSTFGKNMGEECCCSSWLSGSAWTLWVTAPKPKRRDYWIDLSPLQCNCLICKVNNAALHLRTFSKDNELFIGLYGAIDSGVTVIVFWILHAVITVQVLYGVV